MNWIKRFRRFLNARTVTLTLAMVLSMSTVAGGTLAWLMDSTNTLTNTFTYGDVNITLTESETDEDGNPVIDPDTGLPKPSTEGQTYKMTPGATITKDPTVTVLKGTEDCWLFVKIEQSDNFESFMSYVVDEGWTKLNTEDGSIVYYRTVDEADVKEADQAFSVLKDDQVQMLSSVTKEDLNALDASTYPTLAFTAYAVQRDEKIDAVATVEEAWKIATQEATPNS